jgi:hypothetical protein
MNVNELKLLADNGVVAGATIVDTPMGIGFNVLVELNNSINDVLVSDTRHDQVRVFKSIDAAVSVCRKYLGLTGAIKVLA